MHSIARWMLSISRFHPNVRAFQLTGRPGYKQLETPILSCVNASQASCRGFESHHPLQEKPMESRETATYPRWPSSCLAPMCTKCVPKWDFRAQSAQYVRPRAWPHAGSSRRPEHVHARPVPGHVAGEGPPRRMYRLVYLDFRGCENYQHPFDIGLTQLNSLSPGRAHRVPLAYPGTCASTCRR